jgi:hypothetical protein
LGISPITMTPWDGPGAGVTVQVGSRWLVSDASLSNGATPVTSPSHTGSDPLGGSTNCAPRFAGLGLPDADVPIWTPGRLARHAVLTEKSKEIDGLLGHLYGTAVNLLPQLEVPGSMTILAHCVREIYNRFPYFDGFAVPQEQGRRDIATKSLEEVWITLKRPSDDVEAESTEGFAEDPFLSIPRSTHLAVDAVVDAERAGTEAARARHRYYVNGSVSPASGGNSGPSEAEANHCLRFFVGHVHVGTKPPRIERVKVERQFALFERLLDNRLHDFLYASDEVAELLAEANTPRGADGGRT